ncbi:MAG: aldolase/citrate lyase family protein, partial [Loktanella sp.]|nr:aldolase/citrate lyase family protein [Loktanella sp.]
MHNRPYRSALYIPGSKERALDKARGLPVDVILFDLEDAVAPDAKLGARATLAAALGAGGYGPRLTVVRMNGLDTEWAADDAKAVAAMACDAVLLPKVNLAADVDALAAMIPDKPIWAMIETPQGVLNAASIAAHPRMAGFVLGTNDLAKDINSRSRAALMTALQMSVL